MFYGCEETHGKGSSQEGKDLIGAALQFQQYVNKEVAQGSTTRLQAEVKERHWT